MIKRYFTLIALLLPCLAMAQLSKIGTPPSTVYDLGADIPRIATPAVDVDALILEDQEALRSHSPLRFAHGFKVDYNIRDNGRWDNLPNGGRVWRLRIDCRGALNINFLYKDFYLPRGAEFYVYNRDKTQVLGAFTHENNKASRRFATALIHGETAILEYYEPAKITGKGAASIVLEQVAHGYRRLDGSTEALRAGECQVNVNCPEGDNWQDEKKGVARIIMDGLFLCSGSLVNNTANDCTPYFLTANHCIDGGIKQDAIFNPDVSGYIFYWNYEYAGCSAGGSLPEQTTNGGTVVANSGVTQVYTTISSDFALIRLAENPRGRYNVFFNGWDATGAPGNTGVGIHHPAGDDKKISTHYSTPETDGNFWSLFWDPTANGYAVTEGGSSGSPLFRENGRVIGQLFGGSSLNCDDPANDLGLYGKLSHSWTNPDDPMGSNAGRRLDVWLDPIGNGTVRQLDGAYDPCQVPAVYFSQPSSSAAEAEANVNNGCLDYRDYVVELRITPYPGTPVTAFIETAGSAIRGEDYELLNDVLTFNNVTNSQTAAVRVYNDQYVEGAENIILSFVLGGAGGAQPLPQLQQHIISLQDDDALPQTLGAHVQSVRNIQNPAEAYLGPYGKVYFFDAGTGGIMMSLENLSGHDFGCTSVMVDNAGATANNNWPSGSTSGKTFLVQPEFSNPNGNYRISLYYTDTEVEGWELFNAQGDSRTALKVFGFQGAAVPSNESSGTSAPTVLESYDEDFTFSSTLSGGLGGFTIGNLAPAPGLRPTMPGQGNAILYGLAASPNPVRGRLKVEWQTEEITTGLLRISSLDGRVMYEEPVNGEGYQSRMVDVATLPDGVYYLQLVSNRGSVQSLKIVKL